MPGLVELHERAAEKFAIKKRMKAKTTILVITVSMFFTGICPAANFDSGSTGADGLLNVTSNMTLSVPTNGIFNLATITIASGATLSFSNNALNTPVYLLATSDVLITGAISVSGNSPQGFQGGFGGPGGFRGGNGGFALNTTAGDGFGPGAGQGSGARGVFGTNYANALLVPIIGGSGGAGVNGSPGRGGAGGGGAILIASNTKITVNGIVYARGGNAADDCDTGNYGAGSGGAIRVVAPIINGSGELDTLGGLFHGRDQSFHNCASARRYASSGRVRVDCLDRDAFRNLNYVGTTTRGSQMFVFPSIIPKLNITEAAGTSIPESAGQPVAIELPVGSSTNQVVRVQARNFTNDVPITVVVTPENGSSRTFSTNISLLSGSPPSVAVSVIIPSGTVNRIHAWTQ